MTDQTDLKPEFDFRDLIRKPSKLFGYSYVYFLLALVLLGVLYVWNLTTIGKNRAMPVAAKDSPALAQDIPLIAPARIPPVDITKAGVSSEGAIARGREVFRANCVSCHGENGQGDGPTAATLNPKPRNFHVLQGWTNGPKVSQIYRTLQEGIARNGMASYGYLPPADRFALAHYIRTLAPGQPADTPEELRGLETSYQLSKGTDIPGQIPIRKAVQLVVSEHAGATASVTGTVQRIHSEYDRPGARLLRRVARDERRTVITLVEQALPDGGADGFVKRVSVDPLLFGFNPTVNELSENEWQELYNYISSLKKGAQ